MSLHLSPRNPPTQSLKASTTVEHVQLCGFALYNLPALYRMQENSNRQITFCKLGKVRASFISNPILFRVPKGVLPTCPNIDQLWSGRSWTMEDFTAMKIFHCYVSVIKYYRSIEEVK